MTRVEDGDFGLSVMRFQQPLDLSSERHIHVDVDLKVSARRYFRFMLTPQLVKRTHDDRGGNVYPGQAIDVWIKGGGPETFVSRSANADFFGNNDFCDMSDMAASEKQDNVRMPVDLYVGRDHIKVYINGSLKGTCNFAPVAFSQAYLYLEQASYNPCKDGECAGNLQIFHWDNTAFDGPVLPKNGLTPAGMQDVVFNVYAQTSCTVKGVAATNAGNFKGYAWNTYVARMPIQSVSPSDVSCVDGDGGGFWDGAPHGFEVVKR
jgi:hypothetical protein